MDEGVCGCDRGLETGRNVGLITDDPRFWRECDAVVDSVGEGLSNSDESGGEFRLDRWDGCAGDVRCGELGWSETKNAFCGGWVCQDLIL